MFNKNNKSLLVLALLAGSLSGCAHALDRARPFPEPAKGMKRHIILLPEVADQETRRVEIVAGKVRQVDCNPTRFGARLSEHTLQGWGYAYYTVSALEGPISTLMACPPDAAPKQAFVKATFVERPLVRYNARLPLVIYAPEGVEVKYRIWHAGDLRNPS